MRRRRFDRGRLRFAIPRGDGTHGFPWRCLTRGFGAAVRAHAEDVTIGHGRRLLRRSAFARASVTAAAAPAAATPMPAFALVRVPELRRRFLVLFFGFELRLRALG